MLRAHEPLHLPQGDERRQKLLRDLVGEQAVAVLREGRGVEDLLVDRQPDEPAKQHVELQPFDQLPLRADRIEKLQQRRPQQPLRRDGWTPDPVVKRRKPRVELSQSRVRQPPHRPQRMPRRDARLDLDIREQGSARPILAPHRPPRIASPTPQNHAENQNSRTFPRHFFSSLLD